jgi:antitoxin ParD1/3/4
MATMNISLPDQMKDWVEQQVATGRYANASDYFRDLIRRGQDDEQLRLKGIAEVQALIDEGIASGISDKTVEDIRRDVLAELGLSADANAA